MNISPDLPPISGTPGQTPQATGKTKNEVFEGIYKKLREDLGKYSLDNITVIR